MIRVNCYTVNPGWRLLLKDLSIQPVDVLRRANLPEDLLGRDKATISTDEYFRLWLGIEKESEGMNLPLRIGSVISTEDFRGESFCRYNRSNVER